MSVAAKVSPCYVCLAPCTGHDIYGIPLCPDHMPKLDKAESKVVETAVNVKAARPDYAYFGERNFHVKAWRQGGCIVCSKERVAGDVHSGYLAHSDCWMTLSEAEKKYIETNQGDWR